MHRDLSVLALVTLALSAGCGSENLFTPAATRLALSATNTVTWKNLCKRIKFTFTDDTGASVAYGRTDALTVTVTGGTAYATNRCAGDPLTTIAGTADMTGGFFFVKAADVGTVGITVAGTITGTGSLTSQTATAGLVLGQPDFSKATANTNGISAATMNTPLGITRCGNRLLVADTLNNRVLVWSAIPTANGQAADIVLGQAGPAASAAGSTLAGMKTPNSVQCVGDRLYVADFGNSRLLGYASFPGSTGASAAFATAAPGASPSATTVNPTLLSAFGSGLIASDPTWNRVVLWNTAPAAASDAANFVLGQVDLTTVQSPAVTAKTFNHPYATFRGNLLFVADANNNRVLVFDLTTPATNAAAGLVIGQSDFGSGGSGSTAAKLNGPFSVEYDGDHVLVADTNNSRILLWNGLPTANGAPADVVIGAPDTNSVGNGGASAITGVYKALFLDGQYLWVSDDNHRVLQFPAP